MIPEPTPKPSSTSLRTALRIRLAVRRNDSDGPVHGSGASDGMPPLAAASSGSNEEG